MKIENLEKAIDLINEKEEYEKLINTIALHVSHKKPINFSLDTRIVSFKDNKKHINDFLIKDDDLKNILQQIVLDYYSDKLKTTINEIKSL